MKLSIVDLSTLEPGGTRHKALMHSIEIAQIAEKLGFHRFWVAEHHGTRSIAGRVPEVLIAAIAAHTKTIRVGSGSVLLNHYSPFKIAETFSTLNELYPDRIDLGAGRATTGQVLDIALQQDRSRPFHSNSDSQITELVAWLDNSFPADHPFSTTPIHTIESKPQLHVLGSSLWSSSAAAALGLRYVFAGFINQAQAWDILANYRSRFQPTDGQTGVSHPEAILAVHAVCADTEQEAKRQLAPVTLMYQNLAMGIIDGILPSPDDAVEALGGLPDIESYRAGSKHIPKFIGGTPEGVHKQLDDIARDFGVDELMIQDMMTDYEARKRSIEILSSML